MFKLDWQRNQRLNCQHLLDHWKSKSVSEKHLLLLYWLCQSLWFTTNSGKFLDMGIPDHLTYLFRNLYAGQEATVRTGHGTTDWLQIGKGVRQGCILSPCLFNLYAEYIMRNAGLKHSWNQDFWEKYQKPQICRWHHLYGRKWRTKEPLDESERGEWKSWLKTQYSEN